jgi:hypothetical protein
VRKFLFLILLLTSCRATLRPDFVKVVALLGKPSGLDAGNCKSPDQLKAAYATEIAKGALADTLLPFAQRAASLCPGSRVFIRAENVTDLRTIASLIGAPAFAGDGRMQLEPWLWLRVAGGSVIGLELELGKV